MIELVVVLAIMGVLAGIGASRFSRASERAAFSAQHAAFLQIERALELYYIDHEAWPPNSQAGSYPVELAPYLRGDPVAQSPPLGGRWDWNGPGSSVVTHGFNMSVRDTPVPADRWRRFDEAFDDGSLSTGLYRRESVYLVRTVSAP